MGEGKRSRGEKVREVRGEGKGCRWEKTREVDGNTERMGGVRTIRRWGIKSPQASIVTDIKSL